MINHVQHHVWLFSFWDLHLQDARLGLRNLFWARGIIGSNSEGHFHLRREALIHLDLNCIVQPPHLFEGCEAKPMAETIAWSSLLSHVGFHP